MTVTALLAAAETACWVAVPVSVLAAISAAEKRLKRRAVRRWEDRQQAAAQERDPDRAAFDDIVRQLIREDRKP